MEGWGREKRDRNPEPNWRVEDAVGTKDRLECAEARGVPQGSSLLGPPMQRRGICGQLSSILGGELSHTKGNLGSTHSSDQSCVSGLQGKCFNPCPISWASSPVPHFKGGSLFLRIEKRCTQPPDMEGWTPLADSSPHTPLHPVVKSQKQTPL